ncbi:MAG TPA: ATP-dependent metallopeptidase FtsH/Yme1/Tma family protein [Gammaproteobacteria bacterium]|nr:ATP-dependent metallopeptidase FtsH/Yme1/Tma family protein [Gammaproteobacteria bacterium]
MNKSDYNLKPGKPDIEINKPEEDRKERPFWQRPGPWLIFYLIFLFAAFSLFNMPEGGVREIPYSEFLKRLDNNEIKEVLITEKVITGTLNETDPATGRPKRFATVPLHDDALARRLVEHGVTYKVRYTENGLADFLLYWMLPLGLLFLFSGMLARRMGSGSQGFLSIGANKARIHAESGPKVTFDDVAGAEEAKEELKEVIEFLKDPSRIQRLGGRMPKGVLLMGPPGTGKTLLARAVAGEAGVPFFSISGSEFIELFVGVGAARVRDLFQQARKKAPCIIFIDELDAIGRARGAAGPVTGGHDEREQTLNQLLTEMDGFDPSTGVVVMAATNRPEILDKALLRAGRFDRQIVVDKPDLEARVAILRLHTRGMKLADDVDLRVVAQRTPGFVGADLANIANEAAIRAVRKNHDRVTMEDFEAAIDRVIAGPEKKHRGLTDAEKERVAYHESGHTLVAETVPTAEPVHKVSIIPRGVAALGYTLQLPVQEKFLSTEQELKDQIAILLGGRTAEELVYGDISSGAQNDLERASEIARAMVTQLGMSRKLGPLTYGKRQELTFLGVEGPEERNYSEETARLIDAEVKGLVLEGQERARQILSDRREVLEALAAALREKEVMSGDEVRELIHKHDKTLHLKQP